MEPLTIREWRQNRVKTRGVDIKSWVATRVIFSISCQHNTKLTKIVCWAPDIDVLD